MESELFDTPDNFKSNWDKLFLHDAEIKEKNCCYYIFPLLQPALSKSSLEKCSKNENLCC